MPNLNRVSLMGNLTRDPETRQIRNGSQVTEFALAINRKWTDDAGTPHEETTFVEITFWGPRGAAIGKYSRKGVIPSTSRAVFTSTPGRTRRAARTDPS